MRGRSWLLVLGLLLVAAAMRAPLTSVGPVVPAITADLGLSAAAAGMLTALPLLGFAAASVVVPSIAARAGLHPTLLGALLLLAVGTLLRWLPGTVPLFVGTVAVGLAIAVANVLMPVLVRLSFPARIALLTSSYVVFMQVVGGLASGVTVPLADLAPGGWRTALLVWGLPAVLAALLWIPRVRAGGRPPRQERARTPWRSPLAWAVTGYMATQSCVFYVLLAWLPTLLVEETGMSAAAAGWRLSLLQGAGVVAGLVIPHLRGERTVMVVVGTASPLGAALLLLGPAGVLPAVVLLGVGTGGAIVLALAAISARAADAAGSVALSGMAQSVGYLVAAAGPILAGALHTLSGTWSAVLVLLLVVGIVQVVSATVAGRDEVVRV